MFEILLRLLLSLRIGLTVEVWYIRVDERG